MFDVAPKTVSTWRQRYADFPEPDVEIGDSAGWDPSRAKEIQAWEAQRTNHGGAARPKGAAGASPAAVTDFMSGEGCTALHARAWC